uniref:Transcriptional regulator n=1 Tax=Haemonchus contortus TaxID=6289 RepID=A0A7I5EEB6_HAECO
MLGHLLENIWVSADKEFALSWNNRSSVVTDCGRQLTITDQGYAVEVSRRQPRSTPAVGVVTSNQLAAQLLAVEGATYSSMSAVFRNAWQAICDRTNTLSIALHNALSAQPTTTMRTLLGREDIIATYLGGGYVQGLSRSEPPRFIARKPTPFCSRLPPASGGSPRWTADGPLSLLRM